MFKIQLFPLEKLRYPIIPVKNNDYIFLSGKKLLISDKGKRYFIIPRLKRPH